MLEQLDQIHNDALSSLSAIKSIDELENWRITYLGRKSDLMQCFDKIKTLPKEQRPLVGARANQVKKCLGRKIHPKRGRVQASCYRRGIEP